MNRNSIGNRALAALLLVAIASASLAPAALADRDHGRRGRWEHGGPVRVVRHGPCFVERHSDAGALVGFLGGLVVGSILSSTSPPPPPPAPPVYVYHDAFCHRDFDTVEAYEAHLAYHRHPRSVEVVEAHSGRCVDTLEWRDGRWCSRYDRPPGEDWAE
jgi:hypothetical protein